MKTIMSFFAMHRFGDQAHPQSGTDTIYGIETGLGVGPERLVQGLAGEAGRAALNHRFEN